MIYEDFFKEHNTATLIQVEFTELMIVTRHLLNYMGGRYDDLLIYANVAGEYRQFFNQREIDHMVDVRNIFVAGYIIRNIAVAIFVITIAYAVFIDKTLRRIFIKCYFAASLTVLILVTTLLIGIFLDFRHAFIIFHEIFFFNDYWQLDSATSLLINMVPLSFFINMFIMAMTIFLSATFVMCVATGLFLCYLRKR